MLRSDIRRGRRAAAAVVLAPSVAFAVALTSAVALAQDGPGIGNVA